MLNKLKQEMLGFGGLLYSSWQLFIKHFKKILLMVMVLVLPIQIFSIIFYALGDSGPLYTREGEFLVIVVVWILMLGLKLLLGLSATIVVWSDFTDKKLNIGQMLKKSIGLVPEGILIHLYIFIVTIPWAFLVAIPGFMEIESKFVYYLFGLPMFYWTLCYTFSVNELIFNKRLGWDALSYSKELVKANFLKMVGYNAGMMLVVTLIDKLIEFSLYIIPSEWIWLGDNILNIPRYLIAFFHLLTISVLFFNLDWQRIKSTDQLVEEIHLTDSEMSSSNFEV